MQNFQGIGFSILTRLFLVSLILGACAPKEASEPVAASAASTGISSNGLTPTNSQDEPAAGAIEHGKSSLSISLQFLGLPLGVLSALEFKKSAVQANAPTIAEVKAKILQRIQDQKQKLAALPDQLKKAFIERIDQSIAKIDALDPARLSDQAKEAVAAMKEILTALKAALS